MEKSQGQTQKESDPRFPNLIDDIPAIIWITDSNGRVEYTNRACSDFFGVALQDVGVLNWQPPVHPDDAIGYEKVIMECLRERRPCRSQARVQRSDGQVRWIDFQVQPRFSESEYFLGLFVNCVDITNQKLAEENLRINEERFRVALADSPIIVSNVDCELCYTWIYNPHPAFVPEEVVGKRDDELAPLSYVKEFMDFKKTVLQNGVGERREILITVEGEERYYDVQAEPQKDPTGRVTGLTVAAVDVTKRKKAEEAIQSYADLLERSNQELQNFAFIASHDLKEPLRKIVAFSNQIENSPKLEKTERDYLRRMKNAAHRMENMITDLLELSKITTQWKPSEHVDLNTIAKTVIDDLEPRILQTGGKVILNPLPTIEADAIQIHLLIQNLVGNALKYHRPDIPPIVQIGYRHHSEGKVEIFVQDNGIGFQMSNIDRIFQPFQRLHGRSKYEGTGIGLAICKKIAERHNGRITAQSVPGEGSIFSVVLPVKQSGVGGFT
jgi:two-component system, LuxR family, sensor kinase FixL